MRFSAWALAACPSTCVLHAGRRACPMCVCERLFVLAACGHKLIKSVLSASVEHRTIRPHAAPERCVSVLCLVNSLRPVCLKRSKISASNML